MLMKRAILALAFLLLLTISSVAQLPQCADSGGTLIDTLHLQLTFSSSYTLRMQGTSTSGSTYQAIWAVIVERTSTGKINYIIDASSITFSGDCGPVDVMSTTQIFDMLAMATVSQGLAMGYMT